MERVREFHLEYVFEATSMCYAVYLETQNQVPANFSCFKFENFHLRVVPSVASSFVNEDFEQLD